MKKKLYYALALLLVGSFFIITTNIVNFVQNKSHVEAKEVSYQAFVDEHSVPLVFTGRRELNGFKGYHNYRQGYVRYKDNWWYPEAAFSVLPHLNTKHAPLKIVSDIKGTFLVSSLEKKEPWVLKQHIESCRARYRSYNKDDNSYQPFYGPRKPCFSRFFKG